MNYTEIRVGMTVDYHSIIGGPVTEPGCTITHEPWMMNGTWVCMIDKRHGCVSCDALSLPGKSALLSPNVSPPTHQKRHWPGLVTWPGQCRFLGGVNEKLLRGVQKREVGKLGSWEVDNQKLLRGVQGDGFLEKSPHGCWRGLK